MGKEFWSKKTWKDKDRGIWKFDSGEPLSWERWKVPYWYYFILFMFHVQMHSNLQISLNTRHCRNISSLQLRNVSKYPNEHLYLQCVQILSKNSKTSKLFYCAMRIFLRILLAMGYWKKHSVSVQTNNKASSFFCILTPTFIICYVNGSCPGIVFNLVSASVFVVSMILNISKLFKTIQSWIWYLPTFHYLNKAGLWLPILSN